jgi:FkbM family methyltransferase
MSDVLLKLSTMRTFKLTSWDLPSSIESASEQYFSRVLGAGTLSLMLNDLHPSRGSRSPQQPIANGSKHFKHGMTLKQAIVRYTPPQFIHWGKCLFDSGYRFKSRHLGRLKSVPRYQLAVTEILGKPLELVDSASFLSMYCEIFEHQIYRFQAGTSEPYIVDCGSNVGLSVLYFKQLYPQSHIVAFEPDNEIFPVLRRNLQAHGYPDVELHCRALWSAETTLPFWSEGADGGRLSRNGATQDKLVRTVRLRSFLDRQVDLLKLDIEGAETEVLQDCADLLGNVVHLFVEYHSFAAAPQTLHTLTRILSEAGFRLHVQPILSSPQPFIGRRLDAGMDMQLNVFAFRPPDP